MARQYQSGDRPVGGEDYELIEFLGEGQFGEVWKAAGPGGYLVAVKIIDLTRGEGERESKALEQVKHVRHPNLTPVHASFAIDHGANKVADFEAAVKLVVVMGLGDKCLHKRLKECLATGERGIPRDELLRYMDAAAKGLDFLHKPLHDLGGEPVPIIHRDIKPHNILVVGDDAQICDFGLARAMESLQKSQTKTLAGTLAYMAPEVLLESKRGDARSDQYSFAVTYVHLRTGRLPFGLSGEPSAGDIFRAHWEDHLNLLGLEPRERRVIARAVAKEPDKRYATCSQMVEALRAACKPEPKRGWLSTVFGKKAPEPADYPPERVRGPAEPTQPATKTETQRPKVPGTMVAPPPDEADRGQAEQATASHAEPMDKTVPFGPGGTDAVKDRPAPPQEPPREPEVPEREDVREVEAAEPPAPTRRPSRVRRTVAVLLIFAIAIGVAGLSIELWKPGSISGRVATLTGGEKAAFTLSKLEAEVDESGTTDTFTVVLDRQPLSNVVFTVMSGDTGEVTAAPATLSFTSATWDTPQTVTLTGVDDPTVDGPVSTPVTVSVDDAQRDDAWDPLADQSVSVTTTDDDEPGPPGWDSGEFHRLVRDGNYAGAADMVNRASGELVAAAACRDWLSALDELLQGPKLTDAAEMAGHTPTRCIGDASTKWSAAFDRLLKSRDFADAAKLLDPAFSKVANGPTQEHQNRLGQEWLADIQRLWETTKNPQGVQENCEQLLRHFPDSNEAKLILARALVRLAQYEDAQTELEKLDPSPLPEGGHVLHTALRIIVDGFLTPDTVDADRFRTFDNLPTPNDFWGPDEEERGYVQGVRDRVFERYFAQLQEQLRAGDFEAARNTSSEIEDAQLPPDENEEARFRIWQATLELRDPQAPAQDVDQALACVEDDKLPSSLATNDKRELLQALGDVAQKQGYADAELADHLDRAIKLVHAIGQKPPLDRDAPAQLGKLWLRRVAIRVMEPEKPTALAELDDLQKDWKEATKAGFQSTLPDARLGTLVDAWLAECLMESGGNEREVRDLGLLDQPVPEPWAVYVHYVRALAGCKLADPSWDEVVTELNGVFPPDAGAPEVVLKVQGRLVKAASMVVEAAEGQRRQSRPKSPAAPWRAAPFVSPEQADEQYRLLKCVQDLGEAAPDALLDAAGQRQLKVGLALAAFHKTDADVPTAWLLASELSPLSQDLGKDEGPVLYIAVKSYSQHPQAAEFTPADHQIPIQACTRLVRLVDGPERRADTRDETAVALYQEVGEDVLAGAGTLASALQEGPAAEVDIGLLEEFYATLGDYLWDHPYAEWPLKDVTAEVERLFGWAIYLLERRLGAEEPDDQANEKLAGYYLTRGHIRLGLKEPNLDGALDDVNQVITRTGESPRALGLRAHVYLVQARRQQSHEAHLSDLDESIKDGEKAVDGCPETDASLPTHLLNLSGAYVDRANYTRDFTFGDQKEYLKQAIAHANRAKDLEQNYRDYPYLALGNAYEDLAWLVELDPEANYNEAIRAFGAASEERHFAVQALSSRARCYYRAIAETSLKPEDVGKQSRDDVLTACTNDLGKAISFNPKCVEAYDYLATVAQLQEGFAEAADHLEQVKSLAEEQHLPNRADYTAKWARFPLANRDLPDKQRYEEAERRAAVLEAAPAPPGGLMDPKKEAACIRGQVLLAQGRALQAQDQGLQAQKKYEEARALYDRVLPDDLATADWSDFNLLLNRAFCNGYLFGTEGAQSSAEAAIRDADRAAELAIYRGQMVSARSCSAPACWAVSKKLSTSRPSDRKTAEAYVDKCIADYEELIRLAPRNKAAGDWHDQCVEALLQKSDLLRRAPDSGQLIPPEKVADEVLDKLIEIYAKVVELEKALFDMGRVQEEDVKLAQGLYDLFKQERDRRLKKQP